MKLKKIAKIFEEEKKINKKIEKLDKKREKIIE